VASSSGTPIDLHIHFPQGVDTAWYGGALVLALVSLLTGERTRAGKVGRARESEECAIIPHNRGLASYPF